MFANLRRFASSPSRFRPLLLGLLAAGSLSALPAAAVPFEGVYGPPTSADQGARRVKPVRLCPVRGFIAVGTSDVGAINPQVYVVRTDIFGTTMWENVYNIGGGFAGQDEGRAIVELADGSGFVVLGNTWNASWSTALIKIDCNGNVVWTQRYSWTSSSQMRGFDLIQTTTGDASQGTAAGDLAVAGYVSGATPNEDPFLLRTQVNGTLIWNRAYITTANDRFNALTEATPGFGVTGDLVAVGSTVVGTDNQALVARVSGDNGLYGGPYRCVGHYGDTDLQSFFSVVELRTAPYAGELVFAGLTSGAAYSDDIYLVRSQANPCVLLAQARLGDTGQPQQIDREIALDLREILQGLAPTPGMPPIGSLILTGDVADLAFTQSDVPLLAVDPANFNVILGRLFGTQLPGIEVGFSLERIPNYQGGQINGYVIAGLSSSDREGVGDPRDLYMVATDSLLDTPCSRIYKPVVTPLPWPAGHLDPQTYQPAVAASVSTGRSGLDTDYPVCP